jgi:hypothetical protein
MPSAARKLLFTCLALGVGLAGVWQIQLIVQAGDMQRIGEACQRASLSASDRAKFLEAYVDYEPRLGGHFACVLSQFLHRLVVERPAGAASWLVLWSLGGPALVLMSTEAARKGARGPFLRYPALVVLLGLYVGLSVAFAAVWVPSRIWGQPLASHEASMPASLLSRAYWSRFTVAPVLVLTLLVFALSPSSRAWTVAAGLLGGPALALVPVPLRLLDRNKKTPVSTNQDGPDDDDGDDARSALVGSYVVSGLIAFVIWILAVAAVLVAYEVGNARRVLGALWTDASGPVRFMAVDVLVLYAGLLAYLGYLRTSAAVDAVVQTAFLGPGAAVAATLAALELERKQRREGDKAEAAAKKDD